MNKQQLRLYSSLIAKDISPKDTYNLANSIISIETPNGYSVIQKESQAYYGEIINDGRTDKQLTAKEILNKGWWDTKTFDAITDFIFGNQNDIQTTYQKVSRQAVNTPARQQALTRSLRRYGR